MPCFDKKLEASRRDFVHEVSATTVPEVDLVLTTTEVLAILAQHREQGDNVAESESLPAALEKKTDQQTTTTVPFPGLLESSPTAPAPLLEFGGSGGYTEYVFRSAAASLFGVRLDGPLKYHAGKNRDWKELVLEVEGRVVLRFVLAYGFRNIQKVMRDMKRGKANYDFVEVMACPSGCLNGGGQGRPAKTDGASKTDGTGNAAVDSSVSDQAVVRVDELRRLLHSRRGKRGASDDNRMASPGTPAPNQHSQ